MVLANEVSDAIIIEDRKKVFDRFVELSKKPLSHAVRHAFFFHNYVEMRSYHRSCDNPIERSDRFAALYNITSTIKHAFQAAFVLDHRTYPYKKWLYVFANRSYTPKTLLEHVDTIIEELTTNTSSLYGPEKDNRISQQLKVIRRKLIEKAKRDGIDGLWLEKWWRYIDKAAKAINDVRWIDD